MTAFRAATGTRCAATATRPRQGRVSPDKAREMIHAYYASVSFVDAQIGKVLDELRRSELDRNTIVILWSDNGWNLGDHGRWSKPTNYETCADRADDFGAGNAQEPEDRCAGGTDRHLSFAVRTLRVVPPGYLEGTSFVPLLQSPERPWKTAAFTCLTDYTTQSIRTDRYRFIQRASGQNELYDCLSDPAEDHNLASEIGSQKVLQEMQAALHVGWRSAKPRARRAPRVEERASEVTPPR